MRIVIPTRALALPVALLAGLLSIAAPAHADVGEKIIIRCTHGESLSGFTQKDYEKALKELETSSEEYTDCASLIHKAQLAAAGSHGGSAGGPGGGGSASGGAVAGAPAPATAAEQHQLEHPPGEGAAPQQFGNQVGRHRSPLQKLFKSELASRFQPSTITNSSIFNGVEITTGGN